MCLTVPLVSWEKDPDSYRLLNSRGTWSFKGIINLNGKSMMWGQLAASPTQTPHPERYSWSWKGQHCPSRARGCREGKESYLKGLIFWIYRHTNVFLSYPYKYQEICAPFLLIHPLEFQLVLSLNYRESSAVTLHNNSAILAITGRQT